LALAGRFSVGVLMTVSDKSPTLYPLMLLLVVPFVATAKSPDVFWRYAFDRYGKPVLLDPLEVPEGVDPYAYLAEHMGLSRWMTRRTGKFTILFEKAVEGMIPILCIHKISREKRYGLTSERFRILLQFIKNNKWYLISDKQYLEGDFSRVPTGFKPIVLGADDAGYGIFIYQTKGDRLTGPTKRFFSKPLLARDSLVAILERWAPREEGRINFTFYVSFDAIPFRQLDGFKNPGFPYRGVPVVAEKIRYLDKKFILGVHSLSHIYAHSMKPEEFAEDILAAWEMLDEYAGGRAKSLYTMAFPYGIDSLSTEMREVVAALSRNGRKLLGAFDLDGKLAPPPGNPGDRFDVSRLNVDNENWENLMHILHTADVVHARRHIVWEVESKRLPARRSIPNTSAEDSIWVLVSAKDRS